MKIIRTFTILALVCFTAVPAFPTTPAMLTLDIANLMQAIDTLYATYDHINATIESVKNTYKQLENQVKALQNINFDDVAKLQEIKDIRSFEDFSNYRYNIKNAVSNINANMNYLNDIEDTLKDRTITFGGADFTIASLVGAGKEGEKTLLDLPKVTSDYMSEQMDTALAGWEDKLKPEQKVALMRKWGMSPRNYAKWQTANKITSDIISKSIGYGEETIKKIVENMAKKNEAIRIEADLAAQAGSTNGLLDVAIQGLANLSEDLAELKILMEKNAAILSTQALERQLKEDALAESKMDWEKKAGDAASIIPRSVNPYLGNQYVYTY